MRGPGTARTSLRRAAGRGSRGAGVVAVALALVACAPARAALVRDNGVYAGVTGSRVVLGNSVAERRWSRGGLRTMALVDKRRGGQAWARGRRDFALDLGGAAIGSERFRVTGVAVSRLGRGGLRVVMRLAGPAGIDAVRTAKAYPRVAGFRTQTVVAP